MEGITVEVERERWFLASAVEVLVALRSMDKLAATNASWSSEI